MTDVLKKPVHLAILKPTHVQKLAASGRLPDTAFGVSTPEAVHLPMVDKPKAATFNKSAMAGSDLVKRSKKQIKLRVLHESVPPISKDKIPPCDSCKTAACCYAFVVNITQLEYDSGIYGDAAIKITPEIFKQLRSKFALPMLLAAPRQTVEDSYYLEGKIGEPCPFLTKENRCGIYDIRPITCRVYSCVGDSRITEGMRQGTESLDSMSLLLRTYGKKDAE